MREFQKELGRRASQNEEIQTSKTAIFDANVALEHEKDRQIRESVIARQQVKTLTSILAAAEQSPGGDIQAVTAKEYKFKKHLNNIDKKLGVTKTALEDLSKSYLGHLREHKRVEVELQRLRSDIADGEDNVDCLRSQELDCKQKCLSAVRDRDVIRTHLDHLASRYSPSFGVPSADPATPPTGKRSRLLDPEPQKSVPAQRR